MSATPPVTATPAAWETVVGMETHVQLQTRTKMYCGCENAFGDAPNSHVCPVCLGWPGSLPVVNAEAVRLGLKIALALGCQVNPVSQFARKNYFYPDLPKGYQISQFEYPLGEHGALSVRLSDGSIRSIRIRRVHLEEDTAKLLHLETGETLLDHNRAGVPLMEIVTEPDIRSAEEAELYLRELQGILRNVGASQANMEEGHLRCEPNISVRPAGTDLLNPKTEVKNINSFSQVGKAILFEAVRQQELLETGALHGLRPETRGFDEKKQATFVMRVKETAADYRYFPEPDLPPLVIDSGQVDSLRATLEAAPLAIKTALMDEYGLDYYTADLLVERNAATFYREALNLGADSREAAVWLTGETYRLMNVLGRELSELDITPRHLADLVGAIAAGRISKPQGKEVWEAVIRDGGTIAEVISARGLEQISDTGALEALIEEVLNDSAPLVGQFLGGKEALLGAFVGKVMKASGGKANPTLLPVMIRQRLEARRESGGA
ncbi:MAG: Aspartyl/glutamyl-tRNA(Asn/Gln) amidotransferase subunit B [bacterium]|nr:Aspartyl/glutamyl-tRNA(Asn/Gln) amidotransferase subunit B [bacterium]